jgi:hypothetical protein
MCERVSLDSDFNYKEITLKRIILTASLPVAVFLPSVAVASTPTQSHIVKYEHAYAHAKKVFGISTVGCRLMKTCHVKVTDERIMHSTNVLHRMFAPPPKPVVVSTPAPIVSATLAASYSAPAPVATVSSSSAGSVPACASESGTNYSTGSDNTNPSGATGRYQIIPSTAANYGCDLSTPGGQDACAQTIYSHQGAGAWVGCGG